MNQKQIINQNRIPDKFESVLQHIRERETVHISGLAETQIVPVISRILHEEEKQCLIVTSSQAKAENLAKSLSFFIAREIVVLPEAETFYLHYEARSHAQMLKRLQALALLRKDMPCILITPVSGAIKKIPPVSVFEQYGVHLKIGQDNDPEMLRERLTAMGYERAAFVETRGQFSWRGGILDIWAPDGELPCRAEFFDTEVDSLRTFDAESQRSVDTLAGVSIFPAEHMIIDEAVFAEAAGKIEKAYDDAVRRRSGDQAANLKKKKAQLLEYIETKTNLQLLENYINYFYDETAHLWDYMQPGGFVMLDDPDRLAESVSLREAEIQEDFKLFLQRGNAVPSDLGSFSDLDDYRKLFTASRLFFFTPFTRAVSDGGRLTGHHHISARHPSVVSGRLDMLADELKRYVRLGYSVIIVVSTTERRENLLDFLAREELTDRVELRQGVLASGVEFPEEKIVYLWEGDIFAAARRKRSSAGRKKGKPIRTFSDIQKGDFVVHENHGIGKFLGTEQLTVQNVRRDYLKIKYAGADVLYIPVEQMGMIQKYIGGEDAEPRVSRLSSGEWKKAKAKAKVDIAELAKELLELSAARKIRKGYAFAPDTVWQKEFEDRFPYEETQDQLRAIESIKKDMEKPTPMDRLLCGDVGYGKTEVAARAVFKCAADGKQAAILVPTTILANQHYLTFKERFEPFPFSVEMLSRFRTEKQQAEILERIENGVLDIVIGTHRLLSKDIKFKNLGLLVVDEEQRFGVRHKERIKSLKENVDVLTLSATPIPRTLHMSLMGIRDMDLIEEPPGDRYPVQTYVMEQTDEILRETVRRELDRGGQVYVVYNRVRGIQRVADEIRRLVPEAEVVVGHGQMNEHELENAMLDFIEGKYNVLVATTIIESGIDISNVNTILIMDADRFGLSQLYQLRGRVGRSNRMAYAYLLYRKDKVLTEVAEKRLRAIREFTEFGAGFRIAVRDLEIRGAGNILGVEQHGHMMSIGYELYCKLVDDAVRALEGEVVNPDREEVAFEIPVAAFIPDTCIDDEVLKLQMYKKIALVETAEDEAEIVDEFIDRFGDIPKQTMNLVHVARIRAMAERGGIIRIREAQGKLFFEMKNASALIPQRVAAVSAYYKMNLIIHAGSKPFMSLRPGSGEKLKEIMEFLVRFVI